MSNHMMVCLALVGVAAVLLIAGVSGAWVLLPVLGCTLMMGAMMWMMMRGMSHGDKK
jgi:hypothetical protein